MNPTSKPFPIVLEGQTHHLLFDLNTFSAFEEVSGIFFLDFLASIQEALGKAKDSNEPMDLLRNIPVKNIRSMLWAALHTYDRDDNPVWPFTINRLGRMIDLDAIPKLIPALMRAAADNLPEAEPEDREEKATTRPPLAEVLPIDANGGSTSGPMDVERSALLTVVSEN